MAVMQELTSKIKGCILAGKVTITDLARICGCSRQHIYNVLEGKSELTISLAEKIADECGFSLRIGNKKKIPA